MQFFNQVKDRVVTTITRVKPIVLRNSEKLKWKKQPRTPSPSSTTSVSSTDPNAETKNLLPKSKKDSTSEQTSHTVSQKLERTEIETHVINVKSLKNNNVNKEVFQSIEEDLQTLTMNPYNKESNPNNGIISNGHREKPVSAASLSTATKREKPKDNGIGIGGYDEDYGNHIVEMKKQTTQARVIQQDEMLEDMCTVVDRLQIISHDINRELRVQSKLIEEVDEEIEDAQSSFVILGKKMDHLINTENNGFKLIIILSLIVVVLVIIIFFVI